MPATKRTHFIPCQWTALWNMKYYNAFMCNSHSNYNCRSQAIFSLNLPADKILHTKTEKIFVKKSTGLIRLSKQIIIDYAKTYFPLEVTTYQEMSEEELELELDFEEHFSLMEKSLQSVYNLIRTNSIANIGQKTELAFFIFTQRIRNPHSIDSFIKGFHKLGKNKLEAFMFLKHHILANPERLKESIIPIVSRKWTIFKSKRYLPLTDNPIMIHKNNLYVVVSPFLLIKVHAAGVLPGDVCRYRTLRFFQYRLISRLIIENSFTEIIAHERSILEQLQHSTSFREQLNFLRNSTNK